MNVRHTIPALGLAVTLAFSSGLLQGSVIPQGPSLPVFFTGDQDGEVTSCGCPQEDYGGVTRMAAFIDTLRTSGWGMLLLDTGDLTPFDGLGGQNRIKIETLARSMALMGYDAVILGDHDLAHGQEHAARVVGWLGQPVLATNVRFPEDIPSLPSKIVTVRGRKVGLLGFLDPGLVAPVAPWLTVQPWESARARVTALAKETDLLVAMAHAPDTAAVARLAALYPEIDLVLGGHEGRTARDLARRGNTYLTGSSARGRYLGRVEVGFDETGRMNQMAAAYMPVVEKWGRRPGVDALLADYHRDVRKLVTSDAYLAELTRNLMDPPVAYVGTEACVSCHAGQAAQWQATGHAHARETLEAKAKDHDPDCQRCHTTGFGYRTGFVSPVTSPKLWQVGCESCHGGGAEHVADPAQPYGDMIEDTCLSCHDSENSPGFDYETYLPKVAH